MADLPARPDLDQLRHQARELLRAAQRDNPEATARIRAVSEQIILSSAQLALARDGQAASVRRLLAHGADPNLRDPAHHRTPLEEAQNGDSPGHREIQALLRPLTQDPPPPPSLLAPEPGHPNPPRSSHHPRVRPQEPFRNRELPALPG
jgi:hypothetical protein